MGNDPTKHARNIAELEDAMKYGKSNRVEQRQHGWSSEKHPDNIELSEDCLVAKRGPEKRLIEAVRGKVGYSSGIHAFKFSWKQYVKRHLSIGIVSPQTKLSGNGMVIGSNDQSVGWDLIAREIFFNGVAEKRYPERKGEEVPETVVMILDMDDGVLAFKTLTRDLGVAFRGLRRLGSTFHVAAALGAPGDEMKLEYIGSIEDVKVGGKDSSISLAFSPTCGKNALLTNSNKNAERKRALEVGDHATILTSRPLKTGELFQIRVDKTIRGKWGSSVRVGATTISPESVEFGAEMDTHTRGKMWAFCGNRILRNRKYIDEINGDLNRAKVGETAGVKLEKDKLVFYMNGYQQTSVRMDETEPVYGFVDVYGNTAAVSIVASDYKAEDEKELENMIRKSRQGVDMPKTVSEYLQVMETGLSMMKAKQTAHIADIYQLVRCLNKVQLKALTNRQRRQAADTLAHQDGAKIIADYIVFLRANLQTHPDAVQCYPLLRDLCFNYSEHSVLLCKKITRTSLFEMCIHDMLKFKDNYKESERAVRLLKAAMGMLQNCAKVPETKQEFIQHGYMDIAKDYLIPDTNPTWACMQTLFTMSYVHRDSEVRLLVAPNKVLETMSKCLKHGLKDAQNHEYGGWTTLELVSAITNLAVNKDNVKAFMDHGFLEHLVTMLEVGDDYEKECALNAIWNLITDNNKGNVAEVKHLLDLLDTLVEDDNTDVTQAAIRVQLKLETGNILLSNGLPANPGESSSCQYMKTCRRYLDTFNLSEFFFDKDYDVCYCAVCHGHRGDKVRYVAGNPPKGCGVPVGWCRFGLSPPPKAKALDVFSNWHRAYHGTKQEYVKAILEVGELVPAGRDVIGGVKVKEQEGHFDDWRKPAGFDTKKVFLSPSIRYSGFSVYAKPSRFLDPKKKRPYLAKIVFQVLIKPDSYTVGPETIGATGELDPSFSNQELEWSTKQQGSTVLYGLLINLT